MRVFVSLLVGTVAIILAVALAIFAVQNAVPVPSRFLLYAFTGNVWWIAVGAALLGFLVAVLLALPGRLAEIWHDRSMTQQIEQISQELSAAHRRKAGADAARRESQQESQRLQTQLRQLVIEREGLIADRDRLRAERNKLRHQLAMAQIELDTAPVTSVTTAAEMPSWATPVPADEPDEDIATVPLSSSERIEAVDDEADTEADTEAAPAERPKPRGRGRNRVRRSDPAETDLQIVEAPVDDDLAPPEDPISQTA